MCRLAAAHETIRLMLLGLPPDMVHGVFKNYYTGALAPV